MLSELTIITIAYKESEELILTYKSIFELILSGVKWILVINQPLVNFEPYKSTSVITGKDKGLYDAINLGLAEVKSEFFVILHAGDMVMDVNLFIRSLTLMDRGYDCILGGAEIGNRIHMSKYWKKWMFNLYVQPPHLPIIYRTKSCISERYDTRIRTVADFYYLKKLFNKPCFMYVHSGMVYIRMSPGGLTTSGLRSFVHVTKSFVRIDGVKPFLISPIRFILKICLK